MNTKDLPTSTRQAAVSISGIHTEILVQRFTDRILILVTQLNKVGVLYQASAPPNSVSPVQRVRRPTVPELQELQLPPPDPSLTVSRLMGSVTNEEQETLYQLYVSEIASVVLGGLGQLSPEDLDPDTSNYTPFGGRTVVVGLALKDARKVMGDEDAAKLERSTFAEVLKMVLRCRTW